MKKKFKFIVHNFDIKQKKDYIRVQQKLYNTTTRLVLNYILKNSKRTILVSETKRRSRNNNIKEE